MGQSRHAKGNWAFKFELRQSMIEASKSNGENTPPTVPTQAPDGEGG